MSDHKDIALRAQAMQTRGRDFGLIELPGYEAWSNRKLTEGESPALIAHLDAMSMFLLPEDVSDVEEADYEELLEDLRGAIE